MANFCSNCGARLPAGSDICPICNPIEAVVEAKPVDDAGLAAALAAAPKWESEAAQAAAPVAEEDYTANLQRMIAEEERKRRAEESRLWAEEEHKRREEELVALRSAESTEEPAEEQKAAVIPDFMGAGFNLQRTLCAAAYFFPLPIFWVTDYVLKGDEEAKFHSRQGAKLLIAYYILKGINLILDIGLLGAATQLGAIAGLTFGVYNVIKGYRKQLPFLDRLPFLDKIVDKILPR